MQLLASVLIGYCKGERGGGGVGIIMYTVSYRGYRVRAVLVLVLSGLLNTLFALRWGLTLPIIIECPWRCINEQLFTSRAALSVGPQGSDCIMMLPTS